MEPLRGLATVPTTVTTTGTVPEQSGAERVGVGAIAGLELAFLLEVGMLVVPVSVPVSVLVPAASGVVVVRKEREVRSDPKSSG